MTTKTLKKNTTELINDKKNITLRVAQKRSDIIRCQYLIAERYNKYYKIFFSKDTADLNAKIEPYPHKFLMALHEDELVGVIGLYTHNTYIETFGNVSTGEIKKISHQLTKEKPNTTFVEVTKLVITSKWIGTHLSQLLLGAAFSKTFLSSSVNDSQNIIVGTCAKISVFKHLFTPVGISTHLIKDFPKYKVHELYGTKKNPVQSRLIIPELDVPKQLYDLQIPGTHAIDAVKPGYNLKTNDGTIKISRTKKAPPSKTEATNV
ncbi:hypothetical protein HOH87_07005 [bacterium]|jgi:hypothetical protein|nr:hypothetical protein [bacterium]